MIKTDNLKIPNVHKEKFKRAATRADRNFKMLASNSSGVQLDKSENIIKQENKINRGVLGYVINKVTKNKKSKEENDISAVLERNIDKIIDSKIYSSQSPQTFAQQKFFVINALLKYFFIAYQKRIEYKILFSYIKNIISLLSERIRLSKNRGPIEEIDDDKFSFIVKSQVSEIVMLTNRGNH